MWRGATLEQDKKGRRSGREELLLTDYKSPFLIPSALLRVVGGRGCIIVEKEVEPEVLFVSPHHPTKFIYLFIYKLFMLFLSSNFSAFFFPLGAKDIILIILCMYYG